jgi:hypothetical protein
MLAWRGVATALLFVTGCNKSTLRGRGPSTDATGGLAVDLAAGVRASSDGQIYRISR